MLPSLEIQNFRCLEKLVLPSLGRVNLLTGKNNTGKSSVLEAVSLYVSDANMWWILDLLEQRDELSYRERRKTLSLSEVQKIFTSLFHGRPIKIGTHITVGVHNNAENRISLRLVHYTEENVEQLSSQGESTFSKKRTILGTDTDNMFSGSVIVGMERKIGNRIDLFPLQSVYPNRFIDRVAGFNFQLITPRTIDKENNVTLWDTITLTDKEEHVLNALRIIEPSIERLAFISEDENQRHRKPMVKLRNSSTIIPLQSMGDGINRILTIALALVNADNGYLLIDEFENGLHYSVQQKVWESIFALSNTLNVQVFATTHSNDCIQAFGKLLNEQYKGQGMVYRLDNIKGTITPIELTADDISIASQHDIEMR